jgi:16S rRNA (cytosine1402-N4)-methyltransferase
LEKVRYHVPVLVPEVMELLALENRPVGVFLDATCGTCGHLIEAARRLGEGSRVIGMDRDAETLDIARERLEREGIAAELIKGRHSEIADCLRRAGIERVNWTLFDVGQSGVQLDDITRGFSFTGGELDMRMDRTEKMTAFEVVNRYPVKRLEEVLRVLGDEPHSRAIAAAVGEERRKRPIRTNLELVRIIEDATPFGYKRRRIHPATRTFMALMYEVNQVVPELEAGLEQAADALTDGGRMAVITFEGITSRVARTKMRGMRKSSAARRYAFEPVNKNAIKPSREETARNPRARSAVLRGYIKKEDSH